MSRDTENLRAEIDALRRELSRMPVRWGERTINVTSTTGSGSDVDCGTCFDCATSEQATVGTCSECPNGALDQYTFNPGAFTDYPTLGGERTFTYDSACLWLDDPVTITSGADSGVYQWKKEYSLDTDGLLVEEIWLEFISGDNILGLV